jgi:succinate dehydrogenase / fumarate reductase, membrane anchor subunit
MTKSMSGLRDWVIQRLSAIYMAIYAILMFAYLAAHPHLNYQTWQHFFQVFWVQISSLIFLVCLIWHTWIGVWTILTDYVKPACIRGFLEVMVILTLLVYFFWGVQVIWSIPTTWLF